MSEQDTALKILIEQAKQRIENIFTEGWISVETLPERKGYYLCYDTNFGSDEPIDVLFYRPYNQTWFYKADTFHPQFWMPLPANPDESNNNSSKIHFAFKELFEYAENELNYQQ